MLGVVLVYEGAQMTIHKCSQTYKVCPNLQSVPKITKCAQYRDFHSRDSETCVQALVLPSRPAASMRGRSAKKNLGGCEKSIWESVLRVHPHLRGHFGRLRLNLEDMDRATFIGLWYKASTLAHTGGMAAARLLHPVFGGCISARELMLTYGKLTQSVGLGYPRFRREWVCKGMRNDFVAWLLHPAFTAKDREAAQVEHVEINRVLELQRAHEQAVDNLMPCAVECGCANVLNESLVEVRMTAHKNQGLFAVKDVEKDQWLSAYGGVRRSVKVCCCVFAFLSSAML